MWGSRKQNDLNAGEELRSSRQEPMFGESAVVVVDLIGEGGGGGIPGDQVGGGFHNDAYVVGCEVAREGKGPVVDR